MRYIVLLGRVFFALIFLMAAPSLFLGDASQYAASQGIPFASVLVLIAGVISLVGALSVAFGYKAKWGAWLLILFLLPVTVTMHNFWAATDTAAAQMQMVMFLKNLALIGASLLLTYFGAGPVSVDEWLAHRTTRTAPTHQGATV